MAEMKHTKYDLAQMQSLPLPVKIMRSKARIRDWYEHWDGNVAVSYSGGKDSTALLHLVRSIYPDVKAVFSNTGLEYPEIQKFARDQQNVDVVTPEKKFPEVLTTYGYPLISKEVAQIIYYARRLNGNRGFERRKLIGLGEYETGRFCRKKWLPLATEIPVRISHYCCNYLKKSPIKKYQLKLHLKPIIGTLAQESLLREQAWMKTGCNAFEGGSQHSTPMAFWTEQDVLKYIVINDLQICSVYGDIVTEDQDGFQYIATPMTCDTGELKCSGCQRTGCIFCGFGFHLDKGETRFQRLARTHPKQYEYAIKGGQWIDNPDYDPSAPKMDGEWKNWNPEKIWVPSEKGLGMGKVFDMVNEIYGKNIYRYK